MAMNSKTIEGIAVDAVKAKIRLSPILSANIAENDKSPSFDGEIYIHEDSKQTKKNLKILKVQVKGCEKRKFNEKNIMYPINIEDLKNFKMNGGCLFFVVYMRQRETETETKVYYQELTPVKIFGILASTKAKSKPSVLLKALPGKAEEIATIILNCYEQCYMQSSFAKAKELPKLENLDKNLVESIEIPMFGYGIQPKYPAAFNNHDMYMYAKFKNSDILQPLQDQPSQIIDKQEIPQKISVNGEVFFDHFYLLHDGESTKVIIGDSIEISFIDGMPGYKLEYRASPMLRTLYADSSFLIAAIENKGFEIEGEFHDINNKDMDLSHFNIEQQKSNNARMKQIIEMLDQQGCIDDIDVSKLKAEDYKHIDYLIASSIEHKPISGLPDNIPAIITLTIGELQFALWFKQSEDNKGTYMIYNALDYSKPMQARFLDKENLDTPVAVIFDENAYLHISNIQFEKILPSFMKYQATPYIYDISNQVMLRMLSAYDNAMGKRKELLLKTVLDFSSWLEKMPPELFDRRISTLNRLQIYKRIRKLNEMETKELIRIMSGATDEPYIMIGANVLLDRFEDAKYWMEQMPKEQLAEFKKFPIFHLWNKKKNIQ